MLPIMASTGAVITGVSAKLMLTPTTLTRLSIKQFAMWGAVSVVATRVATVVDMVLALARCLLIYDFHALIWEDAFVGGEARCRRGMKT
jgi:hypothetical protein